MNENVSYHQDLQQLTDSLKLNHVTRKSLDSSGEDSADVDVLFLLSVADKLKQSLLDSATLLIYTPRNEHFGIVPLEAMLNGVPVLAANEGGPLETVVDGQTGWLRDASDVKAWTEVMQNVTVLSKARPASLSSMGDAGRARVVEKFSKNKMAQRLDQCLDDLSKASRGPVFSLLQMFVLATMLPLLSCVLVVSHLHYTGRFLGEM